VSTEVPAQDSPVPGGEAGLAELAVEAAKMAGALLLERVRHGAEREVTSKSTPTDLVSEADLASQRAIRELLRERRPADGFLGEEEGESEQGTSGLRWVVDPLDGTVNFLFGIPQWCVSVAVGDEAGTIAAAVFDPNRDELFSATRGGPAELSGPLGLVVLKHRPGADPEHWPGAPAPSDQVSAPAPGGQTSAPGQAGQAADAELLASAMIATGFAYDAELRRAQAQVFAGLVPRVRDIRRFGSAALDLAWTAAGRFDAYYERSVKQWDIAAGALICERAGLQIHELAERGELPWGILAAPPALAAPLRALVS
jgi:myo-inositol-1(or 4)-monophosphatase